MTTDAGRIDRLEGRVEELGQRLTSLENTVNARFSEVNGRINNLMIITVVMWVTTIATLVGLFLGVR